MQHILILFVQDVSRGLLEGGNSLFPLLSLPAAAAPAPLAGPRRGTCTTFARPVPQPQSRFFPGALPLSPQLRSAAARNSSSPHPGRPCHRLYVRSPVSRTPWLPDPRSVFLFYFYFFLRFYLFLRDTEREAGPMQGAQRRTRSRVLRIRPWAEGGTKAPTYGPPHVPVSVKHPSVAS